jgi:hypothetical protein
MSDIDSSGAPPYRLALHDLTSWFWVAGALTLADAFATHMTLPMSVPNVVAPAWLGLCVAVGVRVQRRGGRVGPAKRGATARMQMQSTPATSLSSHNRPALSASAHQRPVTTGENAFAAFHRAQMAQIRTSRTSDRTGHGRAESAPPTAALIPLHCTLRYPGTVSTPRLFIRHADPARPLPGRAACRERRAGAAREAPDLVIAAH